MNLPVDHDNLLDAVLAESAPPDFSTALLGETIQLARRRRRWRLARRTMAVFVLLAVLGAGIWQSTISLSPAGRGSAMGCEIVATQTLPADAIVRTRPFDPKWTVATFAGVDVVQTVPALDNFRFVNDDELLALAAPRSAALVRTGPHTQELIFLVPSESEAGHVN